jgi:AraC family L-rhamnose operon regulatory protein RhaS
MHVTGEDYNRVLGWCELLLQEYQAKEPGYVTVCHSVLMQMIVFLSRKFQIRQREEMTVDYRLAKAVVHMQTNFADRITIDQLADMTGFSGRHFTRLFQQVYGLPPIQFLNELRLKHAKMLLESGNYKVTEVASLCGFQDSNYFSAYFKEKNGCPPSEWRG